MSIFGKSPPPQSGGDKPPASPGGEFHTSEFAKHRLGELRGDDGKGKLFTSDLSVNEFLLVRKVGFEPLGMVVGSSIYHIGYQPQSWAVSQEMTVLSQCMYTARELAMARMEEEARALNADGVVGVRLDIGRYEFGGELAEFIAVGTAVRHRDGAAPRAPGGRPFTSDLSGQDFAVLLASGHRPVGLVMGSCVYHVAHQSLRQAWANAGRNFEMGSFTQAIYDAREIAMDRMQAEAKALGATGIVGVRLTEKSQGWESHVIEYLAVGTAIVPLEGEAPQLPVVLPVSDGRSNTDL